MPRSDEVLMFYPSTLCCYWPDKYPDQYNSSYHRYAYSTNPATLHKPRADDRIPNTVAAPHNRSILLSTITIYLHTDHRNWFVRQQWHYPPDPYRHCAILQRAICQTVPSSFLLLCLC